MSEKIVKVTNGKVVNYKISATGYKTIYGSQLITADTTISKNMITESDPNGVYSLGDRIGNMASFVGYFNSINPDDNSTQKYAVFVLDAAYRGRASYVGNLGTYSGLPLPNNSSVNSTESATYNGDVMYQTYTTSQLQNSAFALCRQYSVVLGGQTYYAQFPNINELSMIAGENGTAGEDFRESLDDLDPTLTSYSNNSLKSWNIAGTSNNMIIASTLGHPDSYNTQKCWYCYTGINVTKSLYNETPLYQTYGVIPVFEIPVE